MDLADFHTATWDRLEIWAKAELERLRAQNDKNATLEATASLRGEIAFCKRLIGLPDACKDKAARDRAEPAEDY